MRSILVLSVLAVLLYSQEAAVLKAPNTRANLSVGNVTAADKLLHRQYLFKGSIPNTVQIQDLVYRGNITNRITAVQANEQGHTNHASAYIISGGIGYSNVTVRLETYRGYGFYYRIEIWGR